MEQLQQINNDKFRQKYGFDKKNLIFLIIILLVSGYTGLKSNKDKVGICERVLTYEYLNKQGYEQIVIKK